MIQSGNTKPPIYTNPGIYKIRCSTCNKFYIGQTGRSFNVRYKEHTRDSENNPSTFFQHLVDENHDVDTIEKAMDILHILAKGPEMNIIEETEIYLHSLNQTQNLLNEQIDLKHKNYIENFIHIIQQENG